MARLFRVCLVAALFRAAPASVRRRPYPASELDGAASCELDGAASCEVDGATLPEAEDRPPEYELPAWYVNFSDFVVSEGAVAIVIVVMLLAIAGCCTARRNACCIGCWALVLLFLFGGGLFPAAALLRPVVTPVILLVMFVMGIALALAGLRFAPLCSPVATVPVVVAVHIAVTRYSPFSPAFWRLPFGGLFVVLSFGVDLIAHFFGEKAGMAVAATLPGLGVGLLAPLFRGDSPQHQVLALVLGAFGLLASYRWGQPLFRGACCLALVFLAGVVEWALRGEASMFRYAVTFVDLEPFRVTVGLMVELAVVQFVRARHRSRYRILAAMLSLWAGFACGGLWPAVFEAARHLQKAVHIVLCAVALRPEVVCQSQENLVRTFGVAGAVVLLLATLINPAMRGRLDESLDELQVDVARLVRMGSLRLQELRQVPNEVQLRRMPSMRTKQRIKQVQKALLEAAREAHKNDERPRKRRRVEGPQYGPVALGAALRSSLGNLWVAQDAFAVQNAFSPLREFFFARGSSRYGLAFWTVTVARANLLEETFDALLGARTDQLLAQTVKVSFKGEPGIDAGGVRRDFFSSVALALAAPGAGLFVTGPGDVLVPAPLESPRVLTLEVRQRYIASGRFLGLALLQQQPLPLSFAAIAYKMLLGADIAGPDVKAIDPQFFQNRIEMLLHEGGVALMEDTVLMEPLFFVSAETALRPVCEPLKPGGESIRVTEANKQEYVQLLCEHYLVGGMKEQISALIEGFRSVVPLQALVRLGVDARDLQILLAGCPTIDVDDWERHSGTASLSGRQAQVAAWFWECVRELNDEDKARLLAFSTGFARAPTDGFASLGFNLSFDTNPDHLPTAHTCSKNLVLPLVTSKLSLKKKLDYVINHGMGFGFA